MRGRQKNAATAEGVTAHRLGCGRSEKSQENRDGKPACQAVCQAADYVHVVGTSKCRRAAFYQRDRAMIERSGLLIAVEGPVRNGETARTLSLAQKKGIPILRIYSSSS